MPLPLLGAGLPAFASVASPGVTPWLGAVPSSSIKTMPVVAGHGGWNATADMPSYISRGTVSRAEQMLEAGILAPTYKPTNWLSTVGPPSGNDVWGKISRNIIDETNGRYAYDITSMDGVAEMIYDASGKAYQITGDAVRNGAYQTFNWATDSIPRGLVSNTDYYLRAGAQFGAEQAYDKGGRIARYGARKAINLTGRAVDEGLEMAAAGTSQFVRRGAGMSFDAFEASARMGGSFVYRTLNSTADILGTLMHGTFTVAAHLLSIPLGIITALLAAGSVVAVSLGLFIRRVSAYVMRPGSWTKAAAEALAEGYRATREGAGAGAAMIRAGTAYAYERGGQGVRTAIDVGRRGVDLGRRGAAAVNRGAAAVGEVAGEGAAMVGRGAAAVGEVVGEGAAMVGRGAVAVGEVAGEGAAMVGRGASAAGELLGEGAALAGRGARAVGGAVGEGLTAAKGFAQRGGAALARASETMAFKVAAGVLQISMEALNFYMIYLQASDLHVEASDLQHIKDAINTGMNGGIDPSQRFQIDEFVRQREASLQQHRINLGINSALTVAGGVVSLSALATGAAMLGPLGWLAIGISLLAVGALYAEQKIDEARIKNDNDAWLTKWYGSATTPSLESYILKRDPTGELAGWMKAVMSMHAVPPLDEEGNPKKGWTKFGIYLWMVQKKVGEITHSAEAGLFDDRFEEFQRLARLNPVSGMSVIQKRWGDEMVVRGAKIQSIFEEGELLSTAISTDLKEGREPENYGPVTQEELNFFFHGGPKPDDADSAAADVAEGDTVGADVTHGSTAAEVVKSATEGPQDEHWKIPDYYKEEAGTRPTGGHGIRGSWEQIAIDEDAAQAREEGAPAGMPEDMEQALAESASMSASVGPGPLGGGIGAPEPALQPRPPPSSEADLSSAKGQQIDQGPWRYPTDAKRSFSQQGLIYDENLASKRRRL